MRRVGLVLFLWLSSATASLAADTASLTPADVRYLQSLGYRQAELAAKAARGATTADFNSGKAVVGTGPYKLVKFVTAESLEVERNDRYWGGKPPWAKVTERIIAKDPSRLASLLSGQVSARVEHAVGSIDADWPLRSEPGTPSLARDPARAQNRSRARPPPAHPALPKLSSEVFLPVRGSGHVRRAWLPSRQAFRTRRLAEGIYRCVR